MKTKLQIENINEEEHIYISLREILFHVLLRPKDLKYLHQI